jgi:hypothetical protein
MFGSSLSPVICRRAHVLFTLFGFVRAFTKSGKRAVMYLCVRRIYFFSLYDFDILCLKLFRQCEPNIVFMLKSYTIPKSNIKIVERANMDTPSTQIHDHSLS